jgi:hypothetical protein
MRHRVSYSLFSLFYFLSTSSFLPSQTLSKRVRSRNSQSEVDKPKPSFSILSLDRNNKVIQDLIQSQFLKRIRENERMKEKEREREFQLIMEMYSYCFGGSPLWMSSSQIPKSIPNCEECGAFRVFELQLLPTLISFLKTPHNEIRAIDFGVLAIYTCSKSCQSSQLYHKEFCFLQLSV